MNYPALARLLVIIGLLVGFALSRDGIDWQLNRAEVVELVALEDGTALITQHGDAGSFISRIKPDGTRTWIARVPGQVWAHAITSNAHRIAVRYETETSCGIATYSEDGQLQWQHDLASPEGVLHCNVSLLANAVFAGEIVAVFESREIIGLSGSDGSERWRTTFAAEAAASLTADGTIMLETFDGARFLDPRTGEMHERRGCQLGVEHLVMHSGAGLDQVLGDRGFAATLPFSSDASVGSVLVACATYRGQVALLVARRGAAPETRLVLLSRSGHVVADHHLPVTATGGRDALAFVPPQRLSFAGDLPRIVPLIAPVLDDEVPILVDLETGAVVATGTPGSGYHAMRDGAAAYFVLDFGHALLALVPDEHLIRPIAWATRGIFNPAQVGGGYIWTFDAYGERLDAPTVTATPALPRRV